MRISELSRRVGVSAETLRAWERRYGVLRPRRSAGNTRLYSALDEARVRLMKRHIGQHMPVAQAAEMAMSARLRLSPGNVDAIAPHEARRVLHDLAGSLDSFDESSADRALQQLFAAYGTTAVLRDVVIPYMHRVGERWAEYQLSVSQEHFASQFFQTRLHALARGWDRGLGPRAVIAAGPDDHHTLGLSCFGIALHQLGWRIVSLGPATPIDMVREAAAATSASLICISTSVEGRLESHTDALRQLSTETTVVIGGHAASARLAQAAGATYLADVVAGAAAVALDAA
jgi:DNA-binding transcriptional MerR regulator/methylmalonyl-CoA mutase cobalamin-binding subunit